MICCDKCIEWFHGKCVGITKSMGKEMEERGAEWICPKCIKKQQPSIKVTIILKAFFRIRAKKKIKIDCQKYVIKATFQRK